MCTVWLVCDYPADHPSELTDKPVLAIGRRLSAFPLTAVYSADGPLGELLPQYLATPVRRCALPTDAAALATAFLQLAAGHDQQHIALCAPTATTRTLLARLLGLPPAQAARICQQAGAINRINVEPHRTVVASINDVCHLHA